MISKDEVIACERALLSAMKDTDLAAYHSGNYVRTWKKSDNQWKMIGGGCVAVP